ncbi:ribonuclease H-like domain-containing protein [Sphingomonas astaxanthinifaciens]|uniref:3'-5' exonuclease n=1 Tax=Sphingomonas astaxanthinifaciens DSM 22298 TaxID=1123267 RepID=A0ABQ5Z9D2_9SPHN|nr:ribonuclease H-like domain-containing protein [Sphingomonas astaxanthinifaciens]GLR48101.1 3'-5' exonuclease [Sphingomonas astaxanthinifaciens DSM 22298]
MKTVTIDVETTLDEEAANRCSYVPTGDFAPFPLHQIVCASALVVIESPKGESFYALETFSRGSMSERGIILSLETVVDDADVVVSFNGYQFDLPVIRARAALYELHIPRLIETHNRSRVGKHLDLFDQLKRTASPAGLAQVCAPFGIPVKQESANTVADLVVRNDWAALEAYCESDVIGSWLASLFWNKVHEPGAAQTAWRAFASWAVEHASEYPSVAAFASVPEPPRQTYPSRGLDDLDF